MTTSTLEPKTAETTQTNTNNHSTPKPQDETMNTQPEVTLSEQEIEQLVESQRRYHRTNATLPVEFRLEQLKKLRDLLH